MSEEQSFLDALKANSADDTTRLVYADWLDDRGEVARAEYLRLVAESRTNVDLASLKPRLLAAGEELDSEWRDAVSARFAVVYLGSARAWEYYVLGVLEAAYRCNRVQFAPLREAAPAVLDDGYTLEAAVRCVEEWTDQCVLRIDPPDRGAVSVNFVPIGDAFRAQLGDARDAWFGVRPMGSLAPPVPNHFEVVLSGRFDSQSSQSAQVADVFAGPLQELFDITEDDARNVLYASGSVPLSGGLSFSAALATIALTNKAVKHHTLARPLREVVSVEIRPEFRI